MNSLITMILVAAIYQQPAIEVPALGASVTLTELTESGFDINIESGCLIEGNIIQDCGFIRNNVKISVNSNSVFRVEIDDYSSNVIRLPSLDSGRLSALFSSGIFCEPNAQVDIYRQQDSTVFSLDAEAVYGQNSIDLPLCRCYFFTEDLDAIDRVICYCRIT